MIGNDVVDLDLARWQSAWERKGFLEKLFLPHEQQLIWAAENPELMVWNLWTRKEAAYKIFNRQTQIRSFNPLDFSCMLNDTFEGTVTIKNKIYTTHTEIQESKIYTIAVCDSALFSKIQVISPEATISKENGIPYWIHPSTKTKNPASITHHGRFWNGIFLES
ncbi:4'-phosphopantetheinyl transferase family protein [Flavobacterium sp. TSSA_36]|uniref:4'-phosphopantetheinyl transferase family protein n=1 Tax=Flavobacterium sp. TSSA_36 TaxID=3447669 RepID=UPI003F391117